MTNTAQSTADAIRAAVAEFHDHPASTAVDGVAVARTALVEALVQVWVHDAEIIGDAYGLKERQPLFERFESQHFCMRKVYGDVEIPDVPVTERGAAFHATQVAYWNACDLYEEAIRAAVRRGEIPPEDEEERLDLGARRFDPAVARNPARLPC